MTAGSSAARRAALDELAPYLIEDGDRNHATVAAIPSLVAAATRLRGAERVEVVRLLGYLAVADPVAAAAQHLAPIAGRGDRGAGVWHRASAIDTACYRAVEAATPALARLLDDRDEASRAAALGLLAVVPPVGADAVEAALADPSPRVRGLARVALARWARYRAAPLDVARLQPGRGRVPAVEVVLSAGARLLASPTSARWRELCAAVAAVPGLRLAAREVAALPVGFRDVVGWALRVLAGADAAAVADPDALTTLLDDGAAGRGEVPEGVLTTLVAAVFPPGRSRGAATVDELSPIERGVLRLLADADPYDEAPFAAVVAAGLPTSWLDDYAVSRVRAVRSYLGVEPPDGYRVVVAGTVAGRRVAWPAFRWAHRVIAGEVPATAFGAAVGAAPRATRIAIATALSVPPADLAAAPGYDRRRLHAVLVDALDVDRATRVAAVARLGDPDVELAGGAALPLLAIAAAVAPDDIDGDAAGYRLGMPRLPGTVEVVREVVGALRGAALAGALDRLGTDEPEAAEPGDGRDDDEDDDDGPGDIDGWDVLDLAEDREDRAARAVAAIRTWDDPPAAAAAARVLQALRGLCPEVVPVIARALADGARPWDGVLRAVTATAARRRPAKLAPRRMRRGPAAR